NGEVTGPITLDGFNPSEAGEGLHVVSYSFQGQFCQSEVTQEVTVHPALNIAISATDTLLCDGGGTIISAEASGGEPNAIYTFNWSAGLLSLNQYYYVTAEDGCSDGALDSILIQILPPISPMVTLSDTVCFGDPGSAQVSFNQDGNFVSFWDGDQGSEYLGSAGDIVELEIEETNQGCTFDTFIFIPSYTPIAAFFSTNPNDACIPWELLPVEFIDLSQNAISGTWDFGNGSSEEYDSGSNPMIDYDTPGNYTVSLDVENEGMCPDSYTLDICIEDPARLFVPDIFSPNDDGLNDLLYVRGQGLASIEFSIYDRWGDLIFRTDNVDFPWDGRFRGAKMPSDVYAYTLVATLNDGSTVSQQGNITLVR
ncbi:MAG: gliding motility-associated C-terminal domain-containing protein, partial [Flavobacteriales bacterium]|nr:gliding motility-associated C-terminal domain-containing protein [Flavobacteriales bacterium]